MITIMMIIIITIIIIIIIITITTTIPRNGVVVITQLKMTMVVITQLKMTIMTIIITAATNISYDDHNSTFNNKMKYLN